MDIDASKQGEIDKTGAFAAIATITAVGCAVGLSFPLLSFLLESRGYSSTLIGANTAMAGIASIAAVPFVTPLAKRIGVINLIALSTAVTAISLIGFFLTPSIGAWFVLRFTFHGALTCIFVLSEFWINSSVPEEKRGLLLGIYGTVLSIGFACGPVILVFVGSKGFWPFGIGALIIVLSVIPALLARNHEPAIGGGEKTPSILRYIWVVPAATLAAFVFGATEQAGFALLPVFGTLAGFVESKTALLLTILAAGNILFQIPLGIVSDRLSDRRIVLAICSAVGVAGSLSLSLVADSFTLLAIVTFFWGGVVGGLYTVGLAHLGSRLTGAELAQANAAFILCYSIGMVVGPQSVGIAMDWYALAGFGYALAILFAGYLAFLMVRIFSTLRS